MSGFIVAQADAIAPASAEFTFDHPDVTDKVGPSWVSIDCWTHTADAVGAAGSVLVCEIEYTDPTGQVILIQTGPIGLDDSTAKRGVPATFMERLDTSSPLIFRTTLFGSAGSALVSYRVLFPQSDNIQVNNLVPV